MSDKERRAAAIDRSEAEAAKAEAYWAKQSAEHERALKVEAVRQAENAMSEALYTKDRYRALFAGVAIFAAAIAVFNAYDKRHMLPECGMWFVKRWQDMAAISRWCADVFVSAVAKMDTSWDLDIVWSYVIAVAVSVLVLSGIVFVMVWALKRIVSLLRHIRGSYADGMLKAVLSISAVLSLFYACLFFYVPIKTALPLNIFSVWLISSLAVCLAVNFPEIREGFKEWRGT